MGFVLLLLLAIKWAFCVLGVFLATMWGFGVVGIGSVVFATVFVFELFVHAAGAMERKSPGSTW